MSKGSVCAREFVGLFITVKHFWFSFVDHVTKACNGNPRPFTAIWVTVPSEKFHLVSALCADPPDGPGLQFHHATGRSATLIRWLDEGPSRIPEYATHQLGVAAEAVVREVYEECNVDAVFSGVIAFRQQHRHPNAFDRSDLLVLCRLNLPPGTIDLPKIRPCQKELSDAKWMTLSELNEAQVHSVLDDHNLRRLASTNEIHITTITKKILDLLSRDSPHPYVELRPEHLQSILKDRSYDLFLPCANNTQ
ncbi:unnamed protein product [Echinostoma caproni]|uniref:Nudix hydrolase domain-containing protein n=1 Tax=Echinostoma caproni TaxID=27848 RepID=A0A3P8K0S7_9TREM|nr:unnamed protein product [Echinostoma caproni]